MNSKVNIVILIFLFVLLVKSDIFYEKFSKSSILRALPYEIPLKILVHLQNIGDVIGNNNEWVGTKNESRRLEGFSVQKKFDRLLMRGTKIIELPSIQYMAHLQGSGDTTFVSEGAFIGTRGQSRRLEGFAIRIVGQYSQFYEIVYQGHFENIGDSPILKNGQFCGTRGQSRRTESIRINLILNQQRTGKQIRRLQREFQEYQKDEKDHRFKEQKKPRI